MTFDSSTHDSRSTIALALALASLLVALVAAGFGMRAIDESKTGVTADSGGGAPPSTLEISLTEMAIDAGDGEVAAGGTLEVVNDGAVIHNLQIEGGSGTADLEAGAEAALSVGQLGAGSYAIFCSVPGHREAGMETSLTVGEATEGMADEDGDAAMSPEEMDELMAGPTKAFPAKTAGLGGQPLAPNVLPDGTKAFELTARVVDWEIEPGKTVKAWTYNGTVPGPTIQVAVGDRVRVVLRNELPESTSIHFHGLRTPNAADGVPDITQAPVRPGTSFTYEFVARGPAVGMYHSHHNASEQVPNGLAATILVGQLPVPAGVSVSRSYPMMLNDAGSIGFSLNGKSFPATEPVVMVKDQWLLVHYLNEGVQAHPMHLHGLEQLVIAKDGFPLPAPYKADTVNVAPGERYSVLVKADELGVWAWHCHILPHAERSTGMFGMVTAMIVKEA